MVTQLEAVGPQQRTPEAARELTLLLFGLLLLVLPLQSAFVLDLGITIRPSHIVGLPLMILTLLAGQLRHPRHSTTLAYLCVWVFSGLGLAVWRKGRMPIASNDG